MIIGVIDNVVRLKKETLQPSFLSDLRNALTRENPAYHQIRAMRERNRRMRFTTLPPATVSSYNENADTVFIPRGFKADLLEMVKANNLEIELDDLTLSYERSLEMNVKDLELRYYQKKAQAALLLNREGVIVAPCGGGKTVVGIAAIMSLKQPTMVLVHTKDLMKQWHDEFEAKATFPGSIGRYGSGIKAIQQVTVGMIQTLMKMSSTEIVALLSRFGCIVLDEAHHCPADTFLGIMNLSKSKYRYGLTATPKRKDGLEFLMHDTIGPILCEITDDDLNAENRSQTCYVREIFTTSYSKHTADNWNELLDDLLTDQSRNVSILGCISRSFQEGHFPLVLSDRVEHCRLLNDNLRQMGMNSHLLIGEVSKSARENIINSARNNQIDCIVATKIADEGLDIPQLSCIHLTTPTANEAKLKQRIGRIRRPIEGKTSVIYDYIDSRISACARMARDRRRYYKRWGFQLLKNP